MKAGRRGRAESNGDVAPDSLELNQRIIKLLQQDGRMPYSTIAAEVGVSEGTVRNRVRQLLDDNIITIQAAALPNAFGYEFSAVTFVKVAAGVHVDRVAERLNAVPEVFYLIMMLGRFDLGVSTYHRSQEDFRQFLSTHCYGHADISHIENSLVLKVHKVNMQWKFDQGVAEACPTLRR